MISNFITKELTETLLGPKFLITFVISTVLIVTSVYTGYQLYESEQQWYVNAVAQNKTRLENSGSYGYMQDIGSKSLREPSRLSIFVRGVDSAIGRSAIVSDDPNIVLRDSRYGLNPVFAVFGELDLAFIATIILPLFALLFSYNAISGERELGTLKQVLSNSVSRSQFIIGKAVGGSLSLIISFLIPFILSLLLLMSVFNVNFTGEEWMRIFTMVIVFCLYLMLFYMIGMLMSAFSRTSAVSFLLCLFIWVMAVAVMPRLSIEIARQISPAPSIDEVEAQRTALQRQFYQEFASNSEAALRDAYRRNTNVTRQETREIRQRVEDEARAKIEDQENNILRNYRLLQERLLATAQTVSRVSPFSCATFAVGRMAHTDAGLRERFLTALSRYNSVFEDYSDMKIRENPDLSISGVSTSIDVSNSDDGSEPVVNISVRAPSNIIDVGDLPRFNVDNEKLDESLAAIIPDLAILIVEFMLLFVATFIAFLKYDVR